MEKETLNAQEIEYLRDHGELPPESLEVLKEEQPKENTVQPTVEVAGTPTINNDVIGKESDPTTADLPKSEPEPKKQQGIDEDPNRG